MNNEMPDLGVKPSWLFQLSPVAAKSQLSEWPQLMADRAEPTEFCPNFRPTESQEILPVSYTHLTLPTSDLV